MTETNKTTEKQDKVKWTKEELEQFRIKALEIVQKNPSICQAHLARALMPFFPTRSNQSVKKKIQALNLDLKIHYARGRQLEVENEWLRENAGEYPLPVLLRRFNKIRKDFNLFPLNEGGLKKRLTQLQISIKLCSSTYFTISEICKGLNCGYMWFRTVINTPQYRKILKPKKRKGLAGYIYFHRAHLREFFLTYPTKLDGLSPDMLWFLDIVTDGKYTFTVGNGFTNSIKANDSPEEQMGELGFELEPIESLTEFDLAV